MDDSHVSGLHGCEESLILDSRDRLSELPNSLILKILSSLPMRDVVGTTLLSKQWKHLWTTVPSLDFSNIPSNIPTDDDSYKFRRFVYGALVLWKGVKILKFSLSLWPYYDSVVSDIYDSWLLFSVQKQVEDLNIDFQKYIPTPYFQPEYFYVPQFLYSCSSIKKLSLSFCELKIDKNVQWNQLKSLTIKATELLSDVSLNHILSGAPQLEVLNLSFLESNENLIINIGSTSLKMLKIHTVRNSWRLHTGAENAMLRIWAPNLQSLEISGVTYTMCVLDVPSLTTAIFDFRDVYMRLHETLRQVFASIHHVRKLTLTYSCIDQSPVAQPLSEISLNHILSGVPNLEVLNLTIWESCENLNIQSTSLKMLKINWSSYTTANKTMLRILAPNLVTLEISGYPNRKCLLNVPSLNNAILVFDLVDDIALQEMLGRSIFESILNHVEKVTLSDTFTEVLLKMEKKYMEIPSNVKFLKLFYTRAPNKILGVLKMFPQLTMLVIECNKRVPLGASEESDALDSKKSCQYLKTVEITWNLHDPSIYLVVEILLKNARRLEKMVFRPLKVSSAESLFLAEEKVRSMPRSSPTAVLIFMNKY